jgi:hypothetical protein
MQNQRGLKDKIQGDRNCTSAMASLEINEVQKYCKDNEDNSRE